MNELSGLDPRHESLRRLIAVSLGPKDDELKTDVEIEAMLDTCDELRMTDEQIDLMLRKAEAEIAATATDAVTVPVLPVLPSVGDVGVNAIPPPSLPLPPAPPVSPALGFVGNLTHLGGSFTPTLWTLLVITAGMVLTLAILAVRGIRVNVDRPEVVYQRMTEKVDQPRASRSQSSDSGAAADRLQAAGEPVALLTRVNDCRWNDGETVPQIGDTLLAGQTFHLTRGFAELCFNLGVKTVLQGPADFTLISNQKVALRSGKITARILEPEARGFAVVTPDTTFVDQGTEFGVEVTHNGSCKVHVFKGAVDVSRIAPGGQNTSVTRRLLENAGAWTEADDDIITLVEDTGDCFVRSIDDVNRDRYTVAYWRFEDRPVGKPLPHSSENTKPVRATADSTCNGNDLFTFYTTKQPLISGGVPAPTIPQTGAANRGCVEITAVLPGPNYLDLYTNAEFSHAAPQNIETIEPEQWTVEASVKASRLVGKTQTFVGRDGAGPMDSPRRPRPAARLAFQIASSNRFAIRFIDANRRPHDALASELPLKASHWYHLAATSDGSSLRLYVDAGDGLGYRLQAETALPKTGSTALGCGSRDAEWSIGRGRNAATGYPGEPFLGWIDEVRISNVARRPDEFLFAKQGTASREQAAGSTEWRGSGKAQIARLKPDTNPQSETQNR